MLISNLGLSGVLLLTPKKIEDERGYFMETYRQDWFDQNIAKTHFVQDNQSFSKCENTVRGLHYQESPFEQGKLVRVIQGAIFDVAVDIRAGSPSFGKWVGAELSAENACQLWIPEGFAHGFCTLTPNCLVQYKVTSKYSKEHDKGLAFDDKDLAIDWPIDISNAILSDKDNAQPSLASLR